MKLVMKNLVLSTLEKERKQELVNAIVTNIGSESQVNTAGIVV